MTYNIALETVALWIIPFSLSPFLFFIFAKYRRNWSVSFSSHFHTTLLLLQYIGQLIDLLLFEKKKPKFLLFLALSKRDVYEKDILNCVTIEKKKKKKIGQCALYTYYIHIHVKVPSVHLKSQFRFAAVRVCQFYGGLCNVHWTSLLKTTSYIARTSFERKCITCI